MIQISGAYIPSDIPLLACGWWWSCASRALMIISVSSWYFCLGRMTNYAAISPPLLQEGLAATFGLATSNIWWADNSWIVQACQNWLNHTLWMRLSSRSCPLLVHLYHVESSTLTNANSRCESSQRVQMRSRSTHRFVWSPAWEETCEHAVDQNTNY